VKRVCVRFRSDDLIPAARTKVLLPLITELSGSLAGEDTSDMLKMVAWDFGSEVHDVFKKGLCQLVWARKVRPILQHLKLDVMILDFYECFCTDRCCNLAGCALKAFMPGCSHRAPKSVEVKDPFDMTSFAERDSGTKGLVEKLIRQWTAPRLQHSGGTDESIDEDTAEMDEAFRKWVKSEEHVSARWSEGSRPQDSW